MGDGEDNEWILEGFLGMGNLFFPEVASNSARFIYRTIYEAQTGQPGVRFMGGMSQPGTWNGHSLQNAADGTDLTLGSEKHWKEGQRKYKSSLHF